MLALVLAASAPSVADMSWLAGHWLACSADSETAETWTDARGGVMLGLSKSVRRQGASWEMSRIDAVPGGIAFFASPKGQAATVFAAVSVTPDRAVFENRGHDFPQRVIYHRDGDRLTGRIEGVVGGKAKSVEWRYRRAAPDEACPAP